MSSSSISTCSCSERCCHDSKTSSTTSHAPESRAAISTPRLLFAHIGAALTLFLATTDATIVATSLPKIAAELDASAAEANWIAVAYLLTQTSFQPLYGKLSDYLGRKIVLYTSMLIFTIGSMLCGSAKSSIWLIVARAISGIGGGGIVACVWTLTSELVPEKDRAKWSQSLSVTWSASAVAGPLLGGLFSGSSSDGAALSWRWAFYINMPISLVAFCVIATSLRGISPGSPPDVSFKQLLQRFDFLGLLLLMGGSTSLILGLTFAGEHGWTSRFTLISLIVGIVVIFLACIHESTTTSRDPLLPPKLFRNLPTMSILVVGFLHQMAFNAGTFFIPVFFQVVKGCPPFQAGVRTLPYSLGSSVATIPSAWLITYLQRRSETTAGPLLVTRLGLCIAAAGFGSMIALDETSPMSLQVLFPMLSGIGVGMLFHAPYQVFLAALDSNEIATGTGAFFLTRFTGATMGLTVAGTIFQTEISKRLPLIDPTISSDAVDLGMLERMGQDNLLQASRAGVALSVRTIWIACVPCLAVAFLISFLSHTTSRPCEDQEADIPETKV